MEFDGEVVDNTAYIVPVGVKSYAHVSPSQYLEVEDLLESLARLPARHVLAIFDSCESGLALSEGREFKKRGGSSLTVPEDLMRRRSRHVVTSAMDAQKAFDDNERYPGNSLFTGWLLEGLRRAAEGGSSDEPSPDQNEDGALTVSEIASFVSGRVSTISGARQTPDHGTFELDQRGELVLMLDTDPFDDLFRLAEELYLEFKIEQFSDAVEEALTVRPAGPRVSYLRYLQASLEGDPSAELRAVRELREFAAVGADIPMERGPLMVALRKAEAACKRGGCLGGRRLRMKCRLSASILVLVLLGCSEDEQGGSIFSVLDTRGRTVALGEEQSGSLTASDVLSAGGRRVQVWTLGTSPGEELQVDLRSDDFDAFLYVVGPGLNEGLRDDDGGSGLNSRLCFVPERPGEYRVVASSLDAGTGAFTIAAGRHQRLVWRRSSSVRDRRPYTVSAGGSLYRGGRRDDRESRRQ